MFQFPIIGFQNVLKKKNYGLVQIALYKYP